MANRPLHIGIKPNVICKGAYCSLKHKGCKRNNDHLLALLWANKGIIKDVIYLSGIPTGSGGKSCHFQERVK